MEIRDNSHTFYANIHAQEYISKPFGNAMYSLSSLRAEGEAIQCGYSLHPLFWIATELSLLAMTGWGMPLAVTAVEKTAFRSHLGIYPKPLQNVYTQVFQNRTWHFASRTACMRNT